MMEKKLYFRVRNFDQFWGTEAEADFKWGKIWSASG
jgi:hypothetical protein